MGFEDQTTGPAIEPREERVHDDNYVLNELKRIGVQNQDAFGAQVTKNWNNDIDIGGHYEFSPERLRLFKNGSRQFIQYGETSNFTDKPDVWTLQPSGGDTMHLESAESATYNVNYVTQASFAFSLNQSLSSGDVFRVGAYNGTDGWVLEQRGSDHADTEADIIESIAGTESTVESTVTLDRPTTEYTRHQLQYNWYNVPGGHEWRQTFFDAGIPKNKLVSRVDSDADRGPETGNLNLWYEIQASSSTTGLELNAGSMAINTLGDITTLNRDKPQLVQETISTADVWEPIYAIRIDPNNINVNCNFTLLRPVNYGNNADVEIVVANVDANKTNATGWDVPDYHHASNSALQSTTNISEVPNDSGTQTTLGTDEMFGGYTIATGFIDAQGNTRATEGTRSTQTLEKKTILNSDHTVIFARTSNVGAEVDFIWDADQRW